MLPSSTPHKVPPANTGVARASFSQQRFRFVVQGVVEEELGRHLDEAVLDPPGAVLVVRLLAEDQKAPIVQGEEEVLPEARRSGAGKVVPGGAVSARRARERTRGTIKARDGQELMRRPNTAIRPTPHGRGCGHSRGRLAWAHCASPRESGACPRRASPTT